MTKTKTIDCDNCETMTRVSALQTNGIEEPEEMEPQFCPFCGESVEYELDSLKEIKLEEFMQQQEDLFEE